jgi:hypothetical protein
MPSFTSTVALLDSNVYGHYLTVPKSISDKYQDTDRRMVAILNETLKIHCALMPKGEGEYMILLHKQIRKTLNLVIGNEVSVNIEKDTSEYGMPLPEELEELWIIDPDAIELFHKLTKGKQRSLIYMIGKGKRPETRAKKAVAIMEYLKTVNGNLDFRQMNQFIKNYNSL